MLPYLPAKLQFLQVYRAIHVIDEINSELLWDQRPKVVGLLFCTCAKKHLYFWKKSV